MRDARADVVRGGIPWRMLPAEDPPWHLVQKTFRRWSDQGRFEEMYAKGLDAAKNVKGRKRHLRTDTLGLPLAVVVQAASVQDRDGADEVVAAGLAKVPAIEAIFADEGCAAACKRRLDANNPGLRAEVMRHPANRSVGTRVQAQEAVVD